ncbi:hypothetical protein [Sulfurimicrobium lacus]|nr:hypothetical protein [Sulfurimicrobium lacus]
MDSTSPQAFSLELTPPEVEARCTALWQQFRSPGRVVTALVAMQSLFALAPAGARENAPYREIQAILARHADDARHLLLGESVQRVLNALQQRETREVGRIHADLSRNGFWQVASAAGHGRDGPELAGDVAWLAQWCQDARARAEAAGGYPDALDFRAAGIDAEEYTAMDELLRCLRSL